MDIVGNGFLARHLKPLADRHPDTVVLAAGVSWASHTSDADFAREAALLREVAADCRATSRRLLFFSTASTGMYGTANGPGHEDLTITPCTPYGTHKLAMEAHLRTSGTDFLALRLGHLVGPGQPPHQLLPTLLRHLQQGTVAVHKGATRDLIDVDDVIAIVDHLLARGLTRQIVNVASGAAVPVDHIIDHLQQRTGLPATRSYIDVGGHHTISIDKLRTLVPEVAAMGFGPHYYRGVLDDFLTASFTPATP
ncbi:NAD-dependent epimerase/dehydratase family protein [Streptomyces sp. CB02959]|uniref:NAD-dependent epimerase/dehydratase family protein n=1 Tax=Streptomyces sp. CB02959 TaxID=2020330 RepID=UPI0015E1526F|nr:NAD(P)-dependent oxidoreductase [Streptomyces sp. CB02959]